MKQTFKCKNCEKCYRVLTKEGFCAFCSLKINKVWSMEFTDHNIKYKREW